MGGLGGALTSAPLGWSDGSIDPIYPRYPRRRRPQGDSSLATPSLSHWIGPGRGVPGHGPGPLRLFGPRDDLHGPDAGRDLRQGIGPGPGLERGDESRVVVDVAR